MLVKLAITIFYVKRNLQYVVSTYDFATIVMHDRYSERCVNYSLFKHAKNFHLFSPFQN